MATTDLFLYDNIAIQVAQNYGDTSDLTIAKAKQWINLALIRISEMGDWSWLWGLSNQYISTVASTEIYVLPVAVKKIYDLYYVSNVRRKLELIDNRRFRQIFSYAVAPSGYPLYYRDLGVDPTTGNKIVAFWPIPNAVFQVYFDYVKEMPLFDASSSLSQDVRIVTGMPAHMVGALTQLATAIGWNELDASNYGEEMAEAIARWQNLYYEDSSQIDDRMRASSFEGETTNYLDPVLPPQYG